MQEVDPLSFSCPWTMAVAIDTAQNQAPCQEGIFHEITKSIIYVQLQRQHAPSSLRGLAVAVTIMTRRRPHQRLAYCSQLGRESSTKVPTLFAVQPFREWTTRRSLINGAPVRILKRPLHYVLINLRSPLVRASLTKWGSCWNSQEAAALHVI
jgi:hypothetical protein